MNRRQLLTGCATGICFVSGCMTSLDAQRGEPNAVNDPEKTIEKFINAVVAGNAETIASLIHSNGKLAGEANTLANTEETVELTSIRTDIAVQAEEEVFVNAKIEYQNETGEEFIDDDLYELREENDQWRVYAELSKIPLEYRLEGVSPAESFTARVGLSQSSAELFFRAADVSAVDMQRSYQENDLDIVAVSFSGGKADQMRETATALGNDLPNAEIFEFLDDKLVNTLQISRRIAQSIQSGQWVGNPQLTLAYKDKELAERVAATVLEHMEG